MTPHSPPSLHDNQAEHLARTETQLSSRTDGTLPRSKALNVPEGELQVNLRCACLPLPRCATVKVEKQPVAAFIDLMENPGKAETAVDSVCCIVLQGQCKLNYLDTLPHFPLCVLCRTGREGFGSSWWSRAIWILPELNKRHDFCWTC